MMSLGMWRRNVTSRICHWYAQFFISFETFHIWPQFAAKYRIVKLPFVEVRTVKSVRQQNQTTFTVLKSYKSPKMSSPSIWCLLMLMLSWDHILETSWCSVLPWITLSLVWHYTLPFLHNIAPKTFQLKVILFSFQTYLWFFLLDWVNTQMLDWSCTNGSVKARLPILK